MSSVPTTSNSTTPVAASENSRGMDYSELLGSLPDSPVSFDEYKTLLAGLVNDSTHPLYHLSYLLEIATGEKRVHSRPPRRFRGRNRAVAVSPVDSHPIDLDGEPAQDGEVSLLQLMKDPTRKRATDQKVAAALCHPREFSGSQETVSSSAAGKDPSGGRSRSQQAMTARAIAQSIAADNQRLATDLARLVPRDVIDFLDEVKRLSSSGGARYGIDDRELAAFLSVCFWTSRPTDQVHMCKLVPSVASYGNDISVWRDENGRLHWVVSAKRPKRKKIEWETERMALPVVSHYSIPFNPKTSEAFEPWLQTVPAGGYAKARIFNRKPAEYADAAVAFFRALRNKHGGRQNLGRINVHLHEAISKLPGSDITLAMAVSGRDDTLGIVPHYYTAHTVQKVREAYCSATNAIWSIYNGLYQYPAEQEPSASASYVGSRVVPRRTVVQALVKRIRKQLTDLRGDGRMVEFHNVLTSYTVLMVGFATGYRAVTDPLFQEAEIDRQTGFAVISDKDGDDFYNSRIIWLPPACLDQLDLYAAHLGELRRWLFTHNQDLFFKSRRKGVEGRRADRRMPSLFFMDVNKRMIRVSSRYLLEYFRLVDYTLPVNANRHYLRTSLMERECPLEVVDAFMGHWENGREPWGRFSGLSPITYRAELARVLVPLLAEDGWAADNGLEVSPSITHD